MTRPSSFFPHPSSFVLRHWLLIIVLLLIAFFFRVHELAGLGLGLAHDEVAEWLIADSIRHGQHALFFEEAYGQEPLFLYLMAGSVTLIGDNVIGVRFTSVFVAMLTLAATYRLLRRLFGPTVALVALAGVSIALWPVFWGRAGLRAMTLPLTMCLGFDFLWRGLTHSEARIAYCVLRIPHRALPLCITGGLLLGLSAYTYLAARAIPILLLAFVLYLALLTRNWMRGRWRNLAVFFVVGVLLMLPLAGYLLANPDLQFRVSEVSRPLDRALAGDASELLANIPRVLGMFTIRGDGTVRDNWPDRPVFPEPFGALLFGFGFIRVLARFRQPPAALALIWIGAMLIPTIVTTGAPNFTRAIGALPMVFALPGLAVEWLDRNLAQARCVKPSPAWLRPILVLGLIGVFGMNAASTYDDYFNKWPAHPETQFVFQSDFAAIAQDIDASGAMDVAVGGLSNDTLDDPSLYLLRHRKDVRVRWFDSGSPISSGGAVIAPDRSSIVYIPRIVPLSNDLDDELSDFSGGLSAPGHFRRYHASLLEGDGVLQQARHFDDSGILLNVARLPEAISAKESFRFITRWLAQEPIAYPRRIFVHLVDPQTKQLIAQHDGLDSPTRFWRGGDQITQIHQLTIPAETPPGEYELWIGLYDPATGVRVLQTDDSRSEPPSDHFVLGAIEVTP